MKIGKHIFGVGLMTAISRVFGFIRDILIAKFLGAGRLSDIFFVAFKLPNLFRDLLGEGALSSVFIPIYSAKEKDESFAKQAFSWLIFILLLIVIVFEIIMPLVVMLMAPGFDPEKLKLTISIARILFFYCFFICSSAFLSAILNTFSKFLLVAFMPVSLNIMLIASLLIFSKTSEIFVLYSMSITVVISGILQMLVLWLSVIKNHFKLKLVKPRLTEDIKVLFKRLMIGILGSGFYQINIIVGTLVASFTSGAVSYLYYSDRLVQLPFAVIGLSAGTVLLSSLSNAIAKKDLKSVYLQQNYSIRKSLMLIIPSLVGLFVLSNPIIKLFFERGAWTPESTNFVANAIMIQVFVLPAMLISQVYSRTLFANQDVKTPVKTSIISLCFSSILFVVLYPFIDYLSIPLGIVLGGYLKNFLLSKACKDKGLFKMESKTIKSIIFYIVLSAILGSVLYFIPTNNLQNLFIAIAFFGFLYLPTAIIVSRKIK